MNCANNILEMARNESGKLKDSIEKNNPLTIDYLDKGVNYHIVFEQINSLAIVNNEISVHKADDVKLNPEILKSRSDLIIVKLTYLTENLQLVEMEKDTAIIRSNKPHLTDNDKNWYEIIMTTGNIALKRHKFTDDKKTISIPFHLTTEVFIRLIKDLTETIRKQ